ncbi:MAG TPA: CocE/NonD family hydrolase [Gemmatimonadales bacterium]|nr:CocE/NonD family hydrolase [Gemmatimonadales bacterium]
MRRALPALPVLLLGLAGALHAQEPFVERNVAVPMRDGVELRAIVARPADLGRFPVLVYRTPYGKDRALESYATWRKAVARGYAVVLQDVRGRYASAGTFDPYRQEGRDGYDTIEWAATQPWSTGAVGTFGLSYPGAVQWLAAVETPPHLRAMVPAMTYASPSNFFYSGGVFDLSWPTWIWTNISADARARANLPGPRTGADAAAAWREIGAGVLARLPLTDQHELRDIAPWYFEWMSHPPGDSWWNWAALEGKFSRVQAAVLNLSGWHDEAYGPDGALNNFLGMRSAAGKPAPPAPRMIIGPWVHGLGGINDHSAQAKSGDRVFGEGAGIDYDEQVLRWMDRWVKGVANGVESEPAVQVYVMGEGRWYTGDRWPLPGTTPRTLYLGPGGAAGPGALTAQPPAAPGTTSFVSDPAAPVTDAYFGRSGAHDYRALAERSDVAVFETAPLTEDLRVVGALTAEVFVSVDAKDTDLWTHVQDVAPDGTAWNLMSPGLNVLRASYRNGGPVRELLTPGRVYRLRLDHLLTGNLFRQGHRIRVVLSTAFMPNFSRNLHTGELETNSAEMRTATITIHYGGSTASRLVLPVVP